MSIKMPKTVQATCSECNQWQKVIWGQYGAEFPCYFCNSAPINLIKIKKGQK